MLTSRGDMKYLLLFALLGVLWLILSKRKPSSSETFRADSQETERMLVCAFCAVNFPESEGIKGSDGAVYCSLEHQRLAHADVVK